MFSMVSLVRFCLRIFERQELEEGDKDILSKAHKEVEDRVGEDTSSGCCHV